MTGGPLTAAEHALEQVVPKSPVELHDEIRHTYDASRDAVRRAHARAEAAAERARRIRAELRQRKAETGNALRPLPGMMALAAEESARSVRENERFLAVVCHELRQPLSAAIAAAALIEHEPVTSGVSRARAVLSRQLLHMSKLLNDLLDMSRLTLQAMQLETARLDVGTVLRDALETVDVAMRERVVALEVALPAAEVPITGDAARLHQAFSNLLTNAVRYTPPGGVVSVSLERDTDEAIVTIADTGQGIAPGDLQNVFEPFWRGGESGREGFGIGLALVQRIIELHGGAVVANSEGRGMGTRFCVRLPLAAAA